MKKANASIQTLSTRVAKYELQLVAEREVGKVDSIRPGIASEYSGAPGAGYPNRLFKGAIKSSEIALSPSAGYAVTGDFNINDYNEALENQQLNEEIKKLLMEN